MLSLLSLKRQGFCNHPANEILNAIVVDEYMNQEVDATDEDDGILSITVLGKASSSSVHATKWNEKCNYSEWVHGYWIVVNVIKNK